MTRYDAVNFISHGQAKRPVPSLEVVYVLSDQSDQKLEEWLAAVLASANFEIRFYRKLIQPGARLTESLSTSGRATSALAIITPEFKKTNLYKAIIQPALFEKLTSKRTLIPLVLGRPIITAPLNDIAQVRLSVTSAENVCQQIFSALKYRGEYDCYAELLASAVRGRTSQRTPKSAPQKNQARKANPRLPGARDFVWKEGVLRQVEFSALQISLGNQSLPPELFLKDYARLISEFASQINDSNHSTYIKDQARQLFGEVRQGPHEWDPQTIDRRVRALLTLLPTDDCPMSKMVELNVHEVNEYQTNFRSIYPIVGDRERVMPAFAIPISAPVQETAQIARRLDQSPELVDSAVPRKLDSLVEDIKRTDEEASQTPGGISSEHAVEEKKRLHFKLAIILNSLWQNLKDPPKMISKIESYKKLYELVAPMFQKVAHWLSPWT